MIRPQSLALAALVVAVALSTARAQSMAPSQPYDPYFPDPGVNLMPNNLGAPRPYMPPSATRPPGTAPGSPGDIGGRSTPAPWGPRTPDPTFGDRRGAPLGPSPQTQSSGGQYSGPYSGPYSGYFLAPRPQPAPRNAARPPAANDNLAGISRWLAPSRGAAGMNAGGMSGGFSLSPTPLRQTSTWQAPAMQGVSPSGGAAAGRTPSADWQEAMLESAKNWDATTDMNGLNGGGLMGAPMGPLGSGWGAPARQAEPQEAAAGASPDAAPQPSVETPDTATGTAETPSEDGDDAPAAAPPQDDSPE